MAMAAGLDLPIINPNVDAMMAAVRSYHLLMNIDTDARDFIAAVSYTHLDVYKRQVGYNKVVNAPPGVLRPGLEAVGPPGVDPGNCLLYTSAISHHRLYYIS